METSQKTPAHKARAFNSFGEEREAKATDTTCKIQKNSHGCWLVIICNELAASFLTQSKAAAYAKEMWS
ncbi:hypothetical protein MMIC_P0874 [Mariprofundus micogutta]|uniref:Uncharacterized protein n=1 Tax=Mariprofundus micogutta TaxID=1921010 RepID=A0A1L8CM01_9PROT|nr:hypothetical protein [Mariprofundus micogutta]GAV19915.1 hypothetical protein MMIC_P0874 [Mariprofundus micogutta]